MLRAALLHGRGARCTDAPHHRRALPRAPSALCTGGAKVRTPVQEELVATVRQADGLISGDAGATTPGFRACSRTGSICSRICAMTRGLIFQPRRRLHRHCGTDGRAAGSTLISVRTTIHALRGWPDAARRDAEYGGSAHLRQIRAPSATAARRSRWRCSSGRSSTSAERASRGGIHELPQPVRPTGRSLAEFRRRQAARASSASRAARSTT